jgi:hypothetical protein
MYQVGAEALLPPRDISVSQWADENVVLTGSGSAERGQWHTRPYQREPMDVLTPSHPCKQVVLMSAAQMLKTSIMVNFLGYIADVDPGPTLAVEPRSEDAKALSIIPASMPPTIVILTGNGAHAWWLFKEPYIFDDDDDRQAIASQVGRWHTLLCLNASSRGWAYDRLSDLARILRIPGTRNLKDPANPKDVVVHSFGERRYNLSDFTQYLDDAAIPDAQAQENAAREWAERFADKPLLINTDARIPQEMLGGWMAADMRFKNTWLRQRHDLKDQSQSGYDLALAHFGTEAGLNEQQIVDLIIHHRSQFAQKPRTRSDYFQRHG